ncbi:FAS1-like dehydratase domain-containing protein [Sediminivirga luteola]|uniref:FAS1-like dehydratase domain-containing protein n=1 Tax=Sediminivirga luteola TaxID=1774748 RepID=A0A8J2TWT2_9MICO|nr:MaoC family dehydratase N-terminal domain-containing protein [Sediminivirga luteola]GGA09834.1 hypothetical protein GCM10011333_10710 [Sediminivirga luteola]
MPGSPVNAEFEGRVFEHPEEFEVSAESIRDFARATGATQESHPAHFDASRAADLGYDGLVAPPTYPVIIAQRAERNYIAHPEAGIDFSRVVHGSERFTYTRPLVAGDRVRASTLVESVRQVGGHAMITTRTSIVDAGAGAESGNGNGEEIVAVTSSIVVRGEE